MMDPEIMASLEAAGYGGSEDDARQWLETTASVLRAVAPHANHETSMFLGVADTLDGMASDDEEGGEA